ncbi:MAG: 4Fe-4S binding protein [Pseudomonadota bacterium]
MTVANRPRFLFIRQNRPRFADVFAGMLARALELVVVTTSILFMPLVGYADEFETASTLALAPEGVTEQLIKDMFPKATAIGELDTSDAIPVRPIHQINQIIGYVYESQDVVSFPGFSGEVMNFLVGVDSQGVIRGVKVLYHHEPIFMHGLGPVPFLEFLDQYAGHSIAERIVVGKGGGALGSDVTYFDGVSKATVSVNIANDTVLVSALKLARARIEAFAQGAAAEVRDDVYEPHTWQSMLDNGLIKTWRLEREKVETGLGSSLEDYADEDLYLEEGDEITLQYAYLNPPSVGQNLLGEAGFNQLLAKLKPNEHAFAVWSTGFYDYIPSDYQPGTVPDRISLLQSGLPIGVRDTNLVDTYELSMVAEAPYVENFRIFKTRAQAGLDPSGPMQMQLMIELRKNHLISDSVTLMDTEYALPAAFFKKVEALDTDSPAPIWLRIWSSRKIEIVVLVVALAVLSVAFAMQRRLTANALWFGRFRFAYLAFTLFFIGIYAQGQLSVVNIFAIQLALRDGFNLDMFLLDPILFVLWVYVFASLFLIGRGIFCGWLCPFGVMQSAMAWLAECLKIKQKRVMPKWHDRLIYAKYGVLALLMGVALFSFEYAQQGAEIEPFKTAVTLTFIREWPFTVYALLILGTGLFINKFYCRYVCPLGAGLAVLGRFRIFSLLERREECGSRCQTCARRCETEAIKKSGEIDYNECVQCLECAVILRDDSQCAIEVTAIKRANRMKRFDTDPDTEIQVLKIG